MTKERKIVEKSDLLSADAYINSRKKIKAVPETDVDRTSAEGKASSVQFLHFIFSEDQIKKFKNLSTEVYIGIDHDLYNHKEKISENIKASLVKDFI